MGRSARPLCALTEQNVARTMNWKLLQAAAVDLNEIENYVQSTFGEATAQKAMLELFDCFDMLADFPYAGIERPDVAGPRYRFFCLPPNWIAYEPGAELIIHRVFSGHMDESTLARSLI